LCSHVPNIWLIDLGWFGLVAKKDGSPNHFSKGAVKEEVWIFSFLLQLIHC
jgi:hypothetical protein